MSTRQAELFQPDARGIERPHLADALPLPCRRLGKRTSELAAASLDRDGTLGRQRAATLAALRAWPGAPPTSNELAQGDVVLRYRYARRLPELARWCALCWCDIDKPPRWDHPGCTCPAPKPTLVTEGPARRCRVSGRSAHVWIAREVARA